MSSLVPPRYELPLVESNGRVSREWYKFLVQMAKALGPSLTTSDDINALQQMDSGMVEGLALSAMAKAQGNEFLAFEPYDQPKAVDTTLLALWPGDAK